MAFWVRRMLLTEVTEPRSIPAAGLKLHADVVIIGSGASGAVMAYELTRAGAKVVVLEAGPYIKSTEFQEHVPTALETLYADHGNQVNTTGDLAILQGKCVGGSTVVNAAVCFRVPNQVLEHWRIEHGLENLTPDYRRVILLARVDGLTTREIAERMERTPNAVKHLLGRALRRLRSEFGDTESLHLPRNRRLQHRSDDGGE